MSTNPDVFDRKTVPAFPRGKHTQLYVEQTALIPGAGGKTTCARVSVYYDTNPTDNGSRVRIYLLNHDLDWKKVDSYGVDLMFLMREARERAKAERVVAGDAVPPEPADAERQVFAIVDEKLREHIAKLQDPMATPQLIVHLADNGELRGELPGINGARPTVELTPGNIEAQVRAALGDERVRLNTLARRKAHDSGGISYYTKDNEVHSALKSDFKAAWGFVTRLVERPLSSAVG